MEKNDIASRVRVKRQACHLITMIAQVIKIKQAFLYKKNPF